MLEETKRRLKLRAALLDGITRRREERMDEGLLSAIEDHILTTELVDLEAATKLAEITTS